MYTLLSIIIISPVFLFSCTANEDYTKQSKKLSNPLSSTSHGVHSPYLRGAISRHDAMTHALSYSPKLQSQRSELRALEAERVQAGLSPNPELAVEIENFAGSGNSNAFNGAQITTAISQRIELGNKRSKRTLIAALAIEKLKAQLSSEEMDVKIAADQAFTTLLEA